VTRPEKIVSLQEAVASIKPGMVVALGGHTLRRHPMALVRELIRQKARDLHVMGWNNGIDFDLLAAAGVMKTAETSCVSLSQFGLGRNFRRAVESGRLPVWDHSETTAIDVFRGAAQGAPYTAAISPLGTSLLDHNPRFRTATNPFDGREVVLVEAVHADVALLHLHMADRYGNVLLDAKRWHDNSFDEYIGRSAKRVIVTVEQIVSDEFVLNNPELTVLPRRYVDAVVEVPFGAHPCACDSRYAYDTQFIQEYVDASKTEGTMQEFIASWVDIPEDEYIERLGPRRLQSLSHSLSARLSEASSND
jgi:glutaconate CoA-transferase, subunit A